MNKNNTKSGASSLPAEKVFNKTSKEHALWVAKQPPCVSQLYLYCIASDQFGDRFEPLHHDLSPNSFKKARKALEDKGLFQFEEVLGRLPSGRFGVTGYKVKNLAGKNTQYWRESTIDSRASKFDNQHQVLIPDYQILNAEHQNLTISTPQALINQGQNLLSESIQSNTEKKEIKNKEKTNPLTQNTIPLDATSLQNGLAQEEIQNTSPVPSTIATNTDESSQEGISSSMTDEELLSYVKDQKTEDSTPEPFIEQITPPEEKTIQPVAVSVVPPQAEQQQVSQEQYLNEYKILIDAGYTTYSIPGTDRIAAIDQYARDEFTARMKQHQESNNLDYLSEEFQMFQKESFKKYVRELREIGQSVRIVSKSLLEPPSVAQKELSTAV